MLNQIETTYTGPAIFPDPSPKLVQDSRIQMTATKMKLAHQQKHLFLAAETPLSREKHVDLPASLNHYLFW